jgi:hypothetical protein
MKGLNPRQWKAAMVYLMALELKAMGGTDYTSALTTTLIDDSAAIQDLNENQRQIARLQIQWNNASANGASMPASVDALNALTACCVDAVPDLDLLILWLSCKLGQHEDYPQ